MATATFDLSSFDRDLPKIHNQSSFPIFHIRPFQKSVIFRLDSKEIEEDQIKHFSKQIHGFLMNIFQCSYKVMKEEFEQLKIFSSVYLFEKSIRPNHILYGISNDQGLCGVLKQIKMNQDQDIYFISPTMAKFDIEILFKNSFPDAKLSKKSYAFLIQLLQGLIHLL
jgi:hypothetical protein